MSGVKVTVTGLDELIAEIRRKVPEGVKKALEETMEDLRRCAYGFAPKDTGHLEQSGRVNINYTKKQIVGEVTYSCTADSYNYAMVMHEGVYNLGEGSQSKGGGTSKFGTVSHSVGRKYLEEPFHQLLPRYIDHLASVVAKELS